MKIVSKAKKNQKGFTAIELLFVVVLIGVLYYIGVRAYGGSTDPANAKAMKSMAKTMSESIALIHAQMGTGLSATSNPLPANGLTMMDVIAVGKAAVQTNYQKDFEQLNMRPLEDDFRVKVRTSGSTPGQYEVLTYPTTFVTCPVGKVCVQYQSVPSTTVAALAARYGISNFNATTALSTGPVRYTAVDSQGFHTVTLENVP